MLLLVDIFFITLFNIVSIKNPSAIAILPLQNPKSNLLGPPRKTREENWKGSQMWANLDATRLVAKWKWKTNRKSDDFCGRLPAKHEKNEKQRQNMIKNYHESVEREAQGVRCLFLLNFFIFLFLSAWAFLSCEKKEIIIFYTLAPHARVLHFLFAAKLVDIFLLMNFILICAICQSLCGQKSLRDSLVQGKGVGPARKAVEMRGNLTSAH